MGQAPVERTLGRVIADADEPVTALDDRTDVENEAIYIWLKGNRIAVHGKHSFALVLDPGLPQAWRSKAMQFASEDKAFAYLASLHLDAATVLKLQKATEALPCSPAQPGPIVLTTPSTLGRPAAAGKAAPARTSLPHKHRPTELDALFARIAPLLVSGRAWVVPVAHLPNHWVGKTDPAVYGRVNSALGARVNFTFLSHCEGGQWLRGYVPVKKTTGKVIGKSGMTIATGFDVGQWYASDLRNKLKLPEPVVGKLKFFTLPEPGQPPLPLSVTYGSGATTPLPKPVMPVGNFKGMTRAAVAQKVANTAPVPELTKEEADAVDEATHRQILSEIMDAWNRRHGAGVPAFTQLPSGWQTVLMSRYFQQGRRFVTSPPGSTFLDQAGRGDWAAAIATFQDFPKHPGLADFGERLKTETQLLRAEMPATVQPSAAAAARSGVPGADKRRVMP